MYVGRDFDPSDLGESERFTFDFVNDLQPGDTITSVTWGCETAAKSPISDASAASRIDGPPVFDATRTTQRVTGMVPGVIYMLQANVMTANGDTLTLWSHVECKDPA